MLKKLLSASLIIALMSPAGTAWTSQDGPVAKVNGVEISRKEFDRGWEAFSRQRSPQMGQTGNQQQQNDMKRSFLDILISQELLWQEASDKKLIPEEQAVSDEIKGIKSRFPSEEIFIKTIEKDGLTQETLKTFISRKLSVQKLIDTEIARKVSVSDEEVHEFYTGNADKFTVPEQVHARHVLIKVDPDADESAKNTARKKIDDILKKAREGSDFASLAKENSECPSSEKGGDLGSFTRGRMVKPFEDAAFALKQGEISDVVETRFGYHIIKVEERMPPSTVSENEVSSKIMDYLKSGKMNSMVQEHIEELRKTAKIEILLEIGQ